MRYSSTTAIALASTLLLSGCGGSSGEGAFYTAPEPAGTNVVQLGSDASVSKLASQLAGLGLTVTSQGGNFVEASGGGPGSDLVDCGSIDQRAFGNNSTFEGDASPSAIYTAFDPPRLMVRQVQHASVVRVELNGQTANVEEMHAITMSWEGGEGEKIGTVRETIGLGEVAEFPDETACTTTGLVSQTIAG